MKRLIYTKQDNLPEVHFTDLFDDISVVVYVDDLNTTEDIFGATYYGNDYFDSVPDSELVKLPKSKLQKIRDLNTIYRLNNLAPQLLTYKQKSDLAKMYKMDPNDLNSAGFRVYMDNNDVANILSMLRKHSHVAGPIYRANDPSKNFAVQHNLNIGPMDYAHILHNLTVDECTVETPYRTFSYSDTAPGSELIVFNVDKNFTLASGQQIGNFKIYIKIDLSKTAGSDNNPIALISFHE